MWWLCQSKNIFPSPTEELGFSKRCAMLMTSIFRLLVSRPEECSSSNYLCLALYFFFKEKGRKALESFTLNLEEALSSNNFLLRNIFPNFFEQFSKINHGAES
jgi:hypothetical protein